MQGVPLAPVRISAPVTGLISLTEAKEHLRVDSSDEDNLINGLIESAIHDIDGYSGTLGRCLINQDWRVSFECWPGCSELVLPFPNVSAVEIKYSDIDDIEQTVYASEYHLIERSSGSAIYFKSTFTYPSLYADRPDRIRVELTAGYGVTAADVPQPIRAAALLLIAHLYENREAAAVGGSQATVIPFGVDRLLSPFRRVRV